MMAMVMVAMVMLLVMMMMMMMVIMAVITVMMMMRRRRMTVAVEATELQRSAQLTSLEERIPRFGRVADHGRNGVQVSRRGLLSSFAASRLSRHKIQQRLHHDAVVGLHYVPCGETASSSAAALSTLFDSCTIREGHAAVGGGRGEEKRGEEEQGRKEGRRRRRRGKVG